MWDVGGVEDGYYYTRMSHTHTHAQTAWQLLKCYVERGRTPTQPALYKTISELSGRPTLPVAIVVSVG